MATRLQQEFQDRPGIVGWVLVAGVVVATDVVLVKNGKPTMSRTLGHFLGHPVAGPLLAGGWAALTYHLLIEERLLTPTTD